MTHYSDDEILAMVRDVDVPEPSPLFWEHFSQRVHDAVATESIPPRGWWSSAVLAWGGGIVVALTAAVLVISMTVRHPSTSIPATPATTQSAAAVASDLPAIEDDESLSLVGDLASQMDWDDAQLAVTPGTVDQAVSQLSPEEREAVVKYLREELKNSNSL